MIRCALLASHSVHGSMNSSLSASRSSRSASSSPHPLVMYDKQPNSPWVARVSLNIIVIIISVLSRACIMVPITKCIRHRSCVYIAKTERPLGDVVLFNRASRGVYGELAILAPSCHVTCFVSVGFVLTHSCDAGRRPLLPADCGILWCSRCR